MSARLRVGMKVLADFGEGHIARRLSDGSFVLFWIDHPMATSRCGWSWIEEATNLETLEYRRLWEKRYKPPPPCGKGG